LPRWRASKARSKTVSHLPDAQCMTRLQKWADEQQKRLDDTRAKIAFLLGAACGAKTKAEAYEFLYKVNDLECNFSGDCTITGDDFERLRAELGIED
jgi:hypothetical protein